MWLHVLQDVDAQLQEFDTKQNIDIGLIIGGKHGAANEPIEDQMDMRQRAGDMHMGHSRSLSAGEPAHGAATAESMVRVQGKILWRQLMPAAGDNDPSTSRHGPPQLSGTGAGPQHKGVCQARMTLVGSPAASPSAQTLLNLLRACLSADQSMQQTSMAHSIPGRRGLVQRLSLVDPAQQSAWSGETEDGGHAPSTPRRVKEFIKKGVVKFKEVGGLCMPCWGLPGLLVRTTALVVYCSSRLPACCQGQEGVMLCRA